MRLENIHLRYTQLFLIGLLLAVAFVVFQSLSEGIEQFEKNFWNRSTLIQAFNQSKLTLGDRVFPQVVIGKDGWMEYSGEGYLDDFQSAAPISAEKLSRTRQKINRLYQQLRDRNITLLIVIAPNKATIYPDKLPDEIQKINQRSYLDAFTDELQKNGPPVLLDLRPALLNGRKKQDVYYRTNTHWNAYGAFIAYTQIIQTLSKKIPLSEPYKITAFSKHSGLYVYDISRLIGMYNIKEKGTELTLKNNPIQWGKELNQDKIVPMQVATTAQETAPDLLIYSDSFGNGLRNFLPLHFHTTTYIQNSSTDLGVISFEKIDAIKPNVIIIEFVERSLYNGRLNNLLNWLLEGKD